MSRPSLRSPELETAICQRLACGDSLVEVCKEDSFPDYSTVIRWVQQDEKFRKMYASARELQGDLSFELAWEEAKKATPENHAAVRIRVDTLKWRASKLKPKVYGDRPAEVNLNQTNNYLVISQEQQKEIQERTRKLLTEK